MSLTRSARWGGLTVAVLLAAYLLGGWLGDRRGSGQARAAEGDRAPEYTAVSLDGDSVRLSDVRPDPVLLNVWATWCVPCIREMPGLDSLHAEYGPRGLRVMGISIDGPNATEEVREFAAMRGIRYPIFHDPSQVVNDLFFTFGVPETFLIDARGRIVRHWSGLVQTGSEAFLAEIEAVLPRQAPPPEPAP